MGRSHSIKAWGMGHATTIVEILRVMDTSGSIVEATSNKESFPKSIMLDSVFASTSIFCRTGPEGCPGKPFSIKNKISLSVVHSKVHNALRFSLVTESAFGFTVKRKESVSMLCFLSNQGDNITKECYRIATFFIFQGRDDWVMDQKITSLR